MTWLKSTFSPPSCRIDGADEMYTLAPTPRGVICCRSFCTTRVSLLIGFGACTASLTGGDFRPNGRLSGGRVDAFLMRLADIQLSPSTLMVAIVVGAVAKATMGSANHSQYAVLMLILIIGLAEWPQYARTVRASVLAEKNKEYVDAARVMGLRSRRIMTRHVLPNTLSPIFVISTANCERDYPRSGAVVFGVSMLETHPSLFADQSRL